MTDHKVADVRKGIEAVHSCSNLSVECWNVLDIGGKPLPKLSCVTPALLVGVSHALAAKLGIAYDPLKDPFAQGEWVGEKAPKEEN